MCLAMPGKILSIEGSVATVDFSGNSIPAEIGLVNAKVGDFVLVHAGCVIQVLSKEDNDIFYDIFKELTEDKDA